MTKDIDTTKTDITVIRIASPRPTWPTFSADIDVMGNRVKRKG
jgi:hypothetical protein